VAARPELVRIETDHRNPNERQPGTLSRWEYTEVEAPKFENEDPEVTQCGASKPAIVVYGEGAGTTRTICIDPACPVHHPSRVVPIDPDAEARRKEHEKEQARRRRLEKDRAETFSRILQNVPANFTAPHLRVLLCAFITCDLYGQSDVVATHYAGEDDDNNQSSEEILLSVADRLEEVPLREQKKLCRYLVESFREGMITNQSWWPRAVWIVLSTRAGVHGPRHQQARLPLRWSLEHEFHARAGRNSKMRLPDHRLCCAILAWSIFADHNLRQVSPQTTSDPIQL
jgi:hypothetical protein